MKPPKPDTGLKTEPEPITSSKISMKWVFIFLVIVFLLWLVFKNPSSFFKKYFWKKELTEVYGVDKKTLNKWVKYFGKDIFPDHKEFLKRRKLSLFEYFGLVQDFGPAGSFPILTKKDIIEKCEGTYRSLRESIQRHPDRFGITAEAFADLRKFPPSIAKQIVERYA